ncbi:FAD-binding oxidoreductase [Pseudooceanicola aestuarii]|uniref:FAD-binding oxidoreductase n=1 Tax=Pseudooceanicola aestuarii TaxID=2697319 RepID=UPI0013D339F3|nr:FAD-binding oxidoreductase [Pseudooceanicola aestuarii]
MSHILTLQEKTPVTHDVNRYVFNRPDPFDFAPGQATEMSIIQPGWEDKGRPFTFTSQPEDDHLEFTIKSYLDHDGVTARLRLLKPGDKVQVTEAFGAIQDQGPGVFLAAGAGITPFISILRRRFRDETLAGSQLLYTNKSEADIIHAEQWEAMTGLPTFFAVTDAQTGRFHPGPIDREVLEARIDSTNGPFYLCGPHGFVDDMRDTLRAMGADADAVITEKGW